MKKLLLLTCLIWVTQQTAVYAQDFEGFIKWTFQTEITDPAQKAQMDAGLAELKKQMNDPKMQQMMQSNPQMKAQMEAMMNNADGGFAGMMPKSMTVKMKDGNSLTVMEGGMAASMVGEILHLKGKEVSYAIQPEKKTYAVIPLEDEHGKDKDHIKVTKTGKHEKVMGYECDQYLVNLKQTGGQPVTQRIWAAPDFDLFDYHELEKLQAGNREGFFYDEIEGMPLKVEMNSGGMKIMIQVDEIKKQPQDASEFKIPAGYKETKFPGN